ncbi:MAG: hypothetical protein KQA41_01850 [Candidatus Aenigmarchaeota archaeon]|nr:hypothetical protein [Candidatus Aenigmarchaeota archaeon]MBU5688949.1 hypothetical protein [Candidatus Aenigmarchaeota archaeon]
MSEEIWSSAMTTKIGGIIFRKALMENNWSKVYENFMFNLIDEEVDSEAGLLKAFGDIGG